MKELIKIQQELKAPKSQFNKFGGYKYRSLEDILEAVKPLLAEQNCTLVVTDELVMIGDRYYVKATATLADSGGNAERATAYAREAEEKKGMDESQITGSASSYARKYALNGLFAIDDTRDADATNTHGKAEETARKPAAKKQTQPQAQEQAQDPEPEPQEEEPALELSAEEAILVIAQCNTQQELLRLFNAQPHLQRDKAFMAALTARKKEIKSQTA